MSAAENPGASIGDVTKAVAELWRGLSEDDKKPFQVQSVLQHPLRRRVSLCPLQQKCFCLTLGIYTHCTTSQACSNFQLTQLYMQYHVELVTCHSCTMVHAVLVTCIYLSALLQLTMVILFWVTGHGRC